MAGICASKDVMFNEYWFPYHILCHTSSMFPSSTSSSSIISMTRMGQIMQVYSTWVYSKWFISELTRNNSLTTIYCLFQYKSQVLRQRQTILLLFFGFNFLTKLQVPTATTILFWNEPSETSIDSLNKLLSTTRFCDPSSILKVFTALDCSLPRIWKRESVSKDLYTLCFCVI